MIQLQTPVDIPASPFSIHPFERMLFVGSCFAQNIGEHCINDRFQAVVNPFGVMYNPASILHTVEQTTFAPRVAVLTLGTNHVYVLKETGEIVDNCQKRPQKLFDEQCLSINDCVDYLEQCIHLLQQRTPDVKVIVTVSPIRYAKYGFHESALSKATLLLAADCLCSKHTGEVFYFPAYEIMNDELRDYRFYKPDMLHPSQQAVDYIYARFVDTFYHADTLRFLQQWKPIQNALAHRPLHPDSEAYRQFHTQTQQQLAALEQQYGRPLKQPFVYNS